MPRIELVEHIQAPPERVWDLLSDVRRGPEWVTVMEEVVSVREEPVRQGTVYRERSKIGPMRSESEWHITTFDPPRRQVHESKEPTAHFVLTVQLEPAQGGTRLLYRTDFQLMPRFRPLGALLETLFVRRVMESELKQTVANAKAILEGRSPIRA